MFVAPSLKLSLSIYVHSTGCFLTVSRNFQFQKEEKTCSVNEEQSYIGKFLKKFFHLGTENREERLKTDTAQCAFCQVRWPCGQKLKSKNTLSDGKKIFLRLFFLCCFRKKTLKLVSLFIFRH